MELLHLRVLVKPATLGANLIILRHNMEFHTPDPDVPEALTRDPTGMKARRHVVIVRPISMDNVRVGRMRMLYIIKLIININRKNLQLSLVGWRKNLNLEPESLGLVHAEAEALSEADKRRKRGRHAGNKTKLPYWEKKALLEDATKKQSTRRNLIWRV